MTDGRFRRSGRAGAAVSLMASAIAAVVVAAGPTAAGAAISWSAVNPPLPSDALAGSGMTLVSTSCPEDGWCVAVGNYPATTGSASYTAGLVLSESGGSWTAAQAPLPANASTSDPQAFVESVSCTAVGSCVAVGRYVDGTGATQGLLERLSGGAWTPNEAPLPAGAVTSGTGDYTELTAVSCPADGVCAAVGRYSGASGDQALLETLAGGTWTPEAAPLPTAPSGSQLLALSCPAAGSCTAVGTDEVSGVFRALAEAQSGSSWTAVALPLPPGSSAAASVANDDISVSCPDSADCTVAGTTFDGAYESFLDTLAGGSWNSVAAPTPGGWPSPDVQLSSVSCAAAGSCVATGMFTAGGVSQGLIEAASGGIWSAEAAPQPSATPAGAAVATLQVTCATTTTCVADGQVDASGVTTGLLWDLAGGSWTVAAAPLPLDASSNPDPSFSPIVCPGSGVCVTVGTYVGTSGREGVAETDPSLAPSTTAVSIQPASAGSMTYSASVSGGAGPPTGTVTFSDGGNVLCSAALVGATASCTAGTAAVPTVLGSYAGDATYAASWGTAIVTGIPAKIVAVGVTTMKVRVNHFFPDRLQALVTDATGAPVAGVAVLFEFPTSGPSATLYGSDVGYTASNGVVTSPPVLANGIKGSYVATGVVVGSPGLTCSWLLKNTKV